MQHNEQPINHYGEPIESGHIYALWIIGGLLFIYLSLPFFEKGSGMFLPDLLKPAKEFVLFQKKSGIINKQNAPNEALLFVTINKKQFLTRFVTYISDEDLSAKVISDSTTGKESKRYVIISKKKSVKPSASKDDFFIKSAPKIQ